MASSGQSTAGTRTSGSAKTPIFIEARRGTKGSCRVARSAGASPQSVSSGPFYATNVVHGTIGTNGGPLVDGDGRIRHTRGGVVEGLYAAGNVAASPLGPTYPGAGC